jgi:hypothetical protein
MLHSRRNIIDSAMATAQPGGAASAARKPRATRQIPLLNRMALLALGAAVAVALTLPAAAGAAASAQVDRFKARSACADERGLTRARHKKFSLKYGVGATNRRAFRRCVKIKARMFARRRPWGLTPPPPAPAPAPTPAPALAPPPMPGLPGMPGFVEMPGVRLQCQMEQMEDPIGFAQEYLGPYGTGIPGYGPIDICVMMESMP